jgi:hypothetical protein
MEKARASGLFFIEAHGSSVHARVIDAGRASPQTGIAYDNTFIFSCLVSTPKAARGFSSSSIGGLASVWSWLLLAGVELARRSRRVLR